MRKIVIHTFIGLLTLTNISLLTAPNVTVAATRLQSEHVKVNEPSNLVGVVRWFDPQRGFGFIRPKGGGSDVFVHFSTIITKSKEKKRFLKPGQRVKFGVVQEENGRKKTSWVVPI